MKDVKLLNFVNCSRDLVEKALTCELTQASFIPDILAEISTTKVFENQIKVVFGPNVLMKQYNVFALDLLQDLDLVVLVLEHPFLITTKSVNSFLKINHFDGKLVAGLLFLLSPEHFCESTASKLLVAEDVIALDRLYFATPGLYATHLFRLLVGQMLQKFGQPRWI